jgi:hypothetical protein
MARIRRWVCEATDTPERKARLTVMGLTPQALARVAMVAGLIWERAE